MKRQAAIIKQTSHAAVIFTLIMVFCAGLIPVRVAKAATSADTPVYDSQFGGFGTGNGQFDYAAGIDTDSSGNIYVSDYANHRIQKFTSEGVYIAKWGSHGSGDGEFDYPYDVFVDAGDNVYVADCGNNRVQKFTANGVYVSQFGSFGTGNGQLDCPSGIAGALDGSIYVVDTSNHRVQKFTANGVYVSQFGSYGSGDGEFSSPYDITTDTDGNIYVADSYNHRVQKFTANGVYVLQFGSYGSGNGEFNYPSDVAIDGSGNIYVVDSSNHRVQKFTANGVYVSQFGSNGSGNGEFEYPYNIAISNSGDILVADYNNNRVQKFVYPVTQQTITSSPGSTGAAATSITIDTPAGTNITTAQSVAATSLATQDTGKIYPFGLLDFTFTAPVGSTNQMTITFVTALTPNQMVARKYNSTTHVYSDIPGATIVETTVGGQHALQLSYSITDGGPLDADGLANGTVVDPVGLALLPTTVASAAELADTGQDSQRVTQFTTVISGISIATIIGMTYRSRRRNSRYKI